MGLRLTANGAFSDIRMAEACAFECVAGIKRRRSVVGVAGHTTINGDHAQAVFAGGTFGPIEIRNVDDPHAAIFLEGNTINGSLTLTNNNSLQDGVAGNTISDNLTCNGDTPLPTNAGLSNSVGGHETGQCVGL